MIRKIEFKRYVAQYVVQSTYELKLYVDDKLADQTANIVKRMDREFAGV